MHPRALRKVLDEEASKWIQSSDDDAMSSDSNIDTSPIISLPKLCSDRTSHVSHGIIRAVGLIKNRDMLRSCMQTLSDQELEMLKLTFSLLDTNGNMTLTAQEISQFIHNVLGEWRYVLENYRPGRMLYKVVRC